jgi:hypothetical protein
MPYRARTVRKAFTEDQDVVGGFGLAPEARPV